MKKFKLFHDCFQYVNGRDSEIFNVDNRFYIVVGGQMIVCPSCGGTGSHDRKDLDCSKLVDSMREDGDHEGIENYFNGAYSQTCTECHGKNVVLAPYNVPEWATKEMCEWDADARADAIYAAKERAYCGA